MSATFVWTVSQLDCIPDVDGKQDYVVTAHWQCVGMEDINPQTNIPKYSAQVYGTCSFPVSQGSSFIPYAVSGVKDEENEDGTPKYQQMDHSSLVPLLIAEIQSLRARVADVEEA